MEVVPSCQRTETVVVELVMTQTWWPREWGEEERWAGRGWADSEEGGREVSGESEKARRDNERSRKMTLSPTE